MSTAIQESVAPLVEEIGRVERKIGESVRRLQYATGLEHYVREDLEREIATQERRLFELEATRDELRAAARERAAAEAESEAAERQVQEEAERIERERLTAETERLELGSAKALDRLQRQAIALGKAYEDFLAIDRELVSVYAGLGPSARSRSEVALGLMAIRLAEGAPGIPRSLDRPFNAHANILIEQFPLLPATGGRPCTVCEHDDRDAIEAALAEGSVREVAERFGVGKSAISRHKQHAATE